nr:beta-ketoacyl-[acyl-carrier-protein] synthase III-like [Nerophis lumbriciformis]
MGAHITGSGIALPEAIVTNQDLAEIMDTSDEWITKRSGVRQRHIAGHGVGSAELGTQAVLAAIADAGLQPEDVDAIISATMTPDHYAPGNAPLIQSRAGLGNIGAFEIRQQCGGFLYGMDMADMLIETERAETVVVVGSEAHRGYMPYGASFDILLGESDAEPTPEDYANATAARAWAVLFGDAGAAMILQPGTPDTGVLGSSLHSNGDLFDLIHVPAPGFVHQPWSSIEQIEEGLHTPQMNGIELFRQAVRLMPEAVLSVLEGSAYSLDDVDLILAHQANQRILDGIAKQLDVAPDRVPSNIANYGNTTAATLPLLYHDVIEEGSLKDNALLAFTAFGAGAHWGALLYRQP